jgi:hypothetical protein
MIDIAAARKIVLEMWTAGCVLNLQTDVILLDERTEEYDWGWVFYLHARDPSLIPESRSYMGTYPSGFLVDRVTGITIPAMSSGLVVSVHRLLELREERLAEQGHEQPESERVGSGPGTS